MIVIWLEEVRIILLSTLSRKRDVITFLEEMKALLEKEDFDIDSKFIPYA